MNIPKAPRLTRDDWLATGLAALADRGPAALAAEKLARRLGTTKGSFYWHFTDLPAYHAALLESWERSAIARTVPATDPAPATPLPVVAQLRALAQSLVASADAATPPVEPAIRAWALSESAAAATLARVDTHRLERLQDLLTGIGIGNPEMSRLILATGIGMAAIAKTDPDEAARAMGSLVDLILALR